MFELGDVELVEHQLIIDVLVDLKFKDVILVGEIFHSLNKVFLSFRNVNECITFLKSKEYSEKTILIKGSRGNQLEKTIDWL